MGKALIFCGIKHCGKSTLGKALAALLKVPFTDTDELLEEKHQCSCRELFKQKGEEEFRRLESELLSALPPADKVEIISLGGGALLKDANFPILQRLGSIIWIDVDDITAFERISRNGLPPFLADAPDPFAEFRKRNALRRQLFEKAASLRFEARSTLAPRDNALALRELLIEKGMI